MKQICKYLSQKRYKKAAYKNESLGYKNLIMQNKAFDIVCTSCFVGATSLALTHLTSLIKVRDERCILYNANQGLNLQKVMVIQTEITAQVVALLKYYF